MTAIKAILLLKPRLIFTDSYYKVILVDERLFFIKVGGQFYEGYDQIGGQSIILDILLWLPERRNRKKRLKKLNKIRISLSTNPDHLMDDKNNYQMKISSIKAVHINENPSFHTGWSDNGKVFIEVGGKKQKYILPLSGTPAKIISFFESASIPIKLTKWGDIERL
ncbi:hypothetical protein [Bacillus sp. 1P06AnD]|uniref:hypothetical protein n=1 Tax=Bacillus sp. 1P06AnD TaxID=3132208 RepID=UPI00399F89DB